MSLKSFFLLDQQVDISLYLTKTTALCHSRELVGLHHPDVSLAHRPFDSPDSKINFISCELALTYVHSTPKIYCVQDLNTD